MSTYKITFSSLNHAWANDAQLSESGQDAGDSANPYTDATYTVTLTLDGSQVAPGGKSDVRVNSSRVNCSEGGG